MELSLVGLVVALVIIGAAFWIVRTLTAAFSIPQPIAAVIYVILVIIVLLWILGQVGVVSPVIRIR